jgi:nitric oxide reductase subunit C
MTPEQIYAGLPDEIAAFFPDSADAGTGEELALISGCTACHSLQEGVVQVGPSWYNVAEHALTRVEGQSPALYLYTSITQPNAYLVEGFQPNLMPLIYKDTLSDEQLANIIAYLLTLRGNE